MTWASVNFGFISYSQNGFNSGWTGWATFVSIVLAEVYVFKSEDKTKVLEAINKKIVAGAELGAAILLILAMIIIKSNEGRALISIGMGLLLCILKGIAIALMPFAIKDDG